MTDHLLFVHRSNPKRNRNCDWVVKCPSKRCKFNSKYGVKAFDGCPAASNQC